MHMHTSFSNVLILIITRKVSETVKTRARCMATITSLRETSVAIPTKTTTLSWNPVSVHLITATITYCNQVLSLTTLQPQPGIAHKMRPLTRETAPVSSTVTAVGIRALSITYRQIQLVKNLSFHMMEARAVEKHVLHTPLPLKVIFLPLFNLEFHIAYNLTFSAPPMHVNNVSLPPKFMLCKFIQKFCNTRNSVQNVLRCNSLLINF